jgi:cell division protein FtsZ
MAQRPTVPEPRLAEVGQRIRAENQRSLERMERAEQSRPEPARPAVATAPTPAPAPAPMPMPAAVAAPTPMSVNASIESAAKAAIAAAVEDVTIRPLTPKPSLFIDPAASAPEPHRPQDAEPAFIPPQPERTPSRAPRMPRIDELPVPAQNEIRARRGELPEAEHPEKRRLSLLERLASVGLGRREQEETKPAPRPRPAQASMLPATERLPGRPMPRASEPRPEPVSEYAKRAPQGLDQHGRQSPVHNSSEEDQLDIPAFLRRQAN